MPPDLASSAEASSSKPASFNIDKFQLSANLFAADIESWIPDTFGPHKSEAQQLAEFNAAIREASLMGNDDLGLGHPDQGKGRSVVGLDSLQRKLGRMEKGKAKATSASQAQERELEKEGEASGSDTEEESRFKMVGKKKRAAIDLMAPKKKAKTSSSSLTPLVPNSSDPLLLKPPSTDSQHSKAPSTDPILLKPPSDKAASLVRDSQGSSDNDGPHTPSPPDDDTFPFSGPISLDSPQAKRIVAAKLLPRSTSTTPIPPSNVKTLLENRPTAASSNSNGLATQTREDAEPEQEDERAGGPQKPLGVGLTKNQRKNERKKRAKLRKQQIHGFS